MAASLAVRTSLDFSARLRSASLWCCDSSCVEPRGIIFTATFLDVSILRQACIHIWEMKYLFPAFCALGQLDFAHATSSDCLS